MAIGLLFEHTSHSRLLNNTEIAKAYGGYDFVLLDMQRVCARQRALTLRAMAEWLDGGCTSHKPGLVRMFCPDCCVDLFEAARLGRMPGDEE